MSNSYISIARWNVEWFLINVSNILKVSHENYIITNIITEFLSFEIELQNRVTQNDVTLRVAKSNILIEHFFWVSNSTSENAN